MIKIIRTDSSNTDFQSLVKQLDAYLAKVDGDDHDFYNQYNGIDELNHTIVAYFDGIPAGCGAVKPFDDSSMEVKRMFVHPEFRGKHIATTILNELEQWSFALNFDRCVLETGKRQIEAVHFYKKAGYTLIPNYGQYAGIDNSLCFEKSLR